MKVTKVGIALGVALFGALCWLAVIGFTAVGEILMALAALVALVGGGNWLAARNGMARRPGGARPASSMLPSGGEGGDGGGDGPAPDAGRP